MAIHINVESRHKRDFPIPRHPNYRITADGTIYDVTSGLTVDWISRSNGTFVVIDNAEYNLDTLLAWAFIGVLPFDTYRTPGSRPGAARGVGYRYTRREMSEDERTIMIDGIEFKRIPVRDFTRYYIGRAGAVYDSVTYRFTHYGMSDNGYPRVRLTKPDGTVETISVNRLVYLAWVGPIDPGTEVDHIDANKTNNDYTNLQLLTHRENIIKSHEQRATGTRRKHENSVFNHETAEKLWRCMIDNNYTVRQVCQQFGIDDIKPVSKLIYKIKMGTVYFDIKQPGDLENYRPGMGARQKYDNAMMNEIREKYRSGQYSLQELADRYRTSYSYVQAACKDIEGGRPSGRPAKYSDANVRAVVDRVHSGMTQRAISEELGIAQQQVSLMARGMYNSKS